MRDRVDLHVHSNRSDGVYTPTHLVRLAEQVGLGGLALTDHDTTAGIDEFLHTSCNSQLIRIGGVEISTEYREQEVHILGYFVSDKAPQLETRLEWLEKTRTLRISRMIHRLNELGIDIDEQDVQRRLSTVKAPGRPHLARILVDMGVVRDLNEAFTLYLGKGRPAYIKKEMMDTREAIALLRSIGSVPVLAHPLILRSISLEAFLTDLRRIGLMGVEVFYDYSGMMIEHNTEELARIADRLGLIKTGGSDYHGDEYDSILGKTTASIEVVTSLQQASMLLKQEMKVD